MPGFPEELLTTQPSSHFVCSICHDVFNEPEQCPQGHVFCGDCISANLAKWSWCPLCACVMAQASLGRCLVLRNMIGEMVVRCPSTLNPMPRSNDVNNSTDGSASVDRDEDACTWKGQLNRLSEHRKLCKHHSHSSSNNNYRPAQEREDEQTQIQPLADTEARQRLLELITAIIFLVAVCCPIAVGCGFGVLVFATAGLFWIAAGMVL